MFIRTIETVCALKWEVINPTLDINIVHSVYTNMHPMPFEIICLILIMIFQLDANVTNLSIAIGLRLNLDSKSKPVVNSNRECNHVGRAVTVVTNL